MSKIDLSKFVLSGQPPVASKKEEGNPHRVTVGQVFIQPTGNETKGYNFTYGYYGLLDKTGKFVAGFSMANIKMLEAVQEGLLPKAFLTAFETYAAQSMAKGKQVIKTAA